MTDKQKEAIELINDLRNKAHISKDEYFLLLDFILEQPQQQIQYIPYYPWSQPSWDTEPHLFRVTCEHNATTTDNINK